jgi:regulatory protein
MENIERIKNYIYWLLGLKDYTANEIRNKVYKRFEEVNNTEVEKVIEYLKECKYIDDDAYCINYIKNKYEFGYGWIRIKGDLIYKKEVKEDFFKEEHDKYDWFKSAKEVKEKKYRDKDFEDYKQKQKAMNYLLRRGFSYEEVQYAFERD